MFKRANGSKLCALSVIVFGTIVMIGWVFDIPILKSGLPGLISMKMNTAFCFVLSGIGLVLASGEDSKSRRFSYFLFALVAIVSLLTFAEYLFHFSLGIDELLIRDYEGTVGRFPPGRLAPVTALDFVLISLSLALAASKNQKFASLSQFSASIVGLVSLQCLVGYLTGQTNLFGSAFYTKMAIHTAGEFLILATGTILLTSQVGFISVYTTKNEARLLTRWMLAASVVIPVLVRILATSGFKHGLFDEDFSQLFQIVGTTALLSAIVTLLGLAMVRSVAKSREVEVEIRASEQKFKALIDASAQISWTADRDGKTTEDSPTWREFTGQTFEEWQGDGWLQASTRMIAQMSHGYGRKRARRKKYSRPNTV